ncbi:msx2-interacting protein isoform X2 [Boleophthalmus pectinirostris]|uniref:msx2-interacting protein isoform X2 n=1 Tax=Boleophthalmus pectinirostris TaxID=150288 RepID=UPI00242A363E|nr:msx2-interacting protein isoform X2 [Boleophthalmus pectinirostris]
MVRETRHLWVGNLPEHVREEKIVEHFKRYGRVESVKVLRKRGSEGGVAAFVDFVDIKSAQKAHNAVNKMGDRDLRTDYNEPGSVPSAVRGLEDGSPSSSRDVTGFSRGTVGPVFGPPVSLHTREGRYERRIDGSESRDRAYDHSPYGHHERSSTFDRQRHYNADYYRDRSMFAAAGSGSSAISGTFEASDPHFEARLRDPFTLTSASRRDLYRDDRGRRIDRTYHHRRSRSSHSSQSRQPSPQRTTGQTPKSSHSPKRAPLSPGRGPRSRSHSRSSSSDSVSSSSSTGSGSESNSSSSDGSRARSVQSSATHAPPASVILDTDEPRRSFGIKVQNLPVRSTDTSLKDGLFHEFKKHGKVTSVQIHGASEDRYGLVFFRQQEDQEKALSVSKGKLFFGMLIEVTAYNGPETESENEFRPLDGRIDEFHPKATRTLFIGNLEKTTSYQQLLDVFQRFGEIVDIDIKKVNGVPQYAFVQYSDIASVCKAIKKMDGEYLGSNRLKLGFGKSMPTTCVWLDGLASNITEQYLTRHFCRYGHVVKVVLDRLKGMALILYNNTDFAQAAVRETKGWKLGGNKIKVDFASQESQLAFYRSMQASGQDIREFYDLPLERREERRPPYHEFTERAYYENLRTPGLYPEEARREYAARRERFPELEHYQGDHFDPRYHEDPRDYRDYRDPFEQDIRKYTYIQRERERERERFEADRSRWSPSHPRRPITPAVSPSPSERERAPRDSERRVFSQSSERSGSVSSMSPPHFDKSDKSLEHGSKNDKTEKTAPTDRLLSSEKTKRMKRKDKIDKGEKVKSRKTKAQSPSSQILEAEPEAGLEGGAGRSKGSDQDSYERQKYKGDLDNHEVGKNETSELSKGENLEMDGKTRLKKQIKTELGSDGKDSVDSERLAARKRRFAESSGKVIRQKKSKIDEEEPAECSAGGVHQKEMDTHKDSQRRDSRPKTDKAQKEGQEDQKGHKEKGDMSSELQDSKRHSLSRRFSHEGGPDQANSREEQHVPLKFGASSDIDKSAKNKDDHVDIDLSQSYRKQMEQNRRLQQQQRESDKLEKPESPLEIKNEDMEDRSLVYEVGKPPEDVTVTDNFPSHRFKKLDQFDAETGVKRERVYRSFRHKSEDSEWNSGLSPGHSHHMDNDFVSPSRKELSRIDDKLPEIERLKKTLDSQVKPHTPMLGGEEEQQKRWENRVKQVDNFLQDQNFSRGKGFHNRKRLEYGVWPDLEPGEVRSDSEEDREPKSHSPVPSTSMNFSERLRGERFSDPKLAQLEKNKFYSFAHDRTITPDTKALLERAKSLSREDNWSFLDYDPHLASFRDRKDTVKVESAPKPIKPVSWYRRYKTRSGSEDKLDDRKEEPKPEEPERKELFASRFFHSAVFELDSRRLQHLERKHEEPENNQSQLGVQDGVDGEIESGPVILFHSRFLELTKQQQKNKPQEAKVEPSVEENKVQNAMRQDPQAPVSQSPQTESPRETEVKPISPVEEIASEPQLLPAPPAPPTPQPEVKTMSPAEVKPEPVIPTPEPSSPVFLVKEETKEEVKVNYHVDLLPQSVSEVLPKSEPIPEIDFPHEKSHPSPIEVKLEINETVKSQDSGAKSRHSSQDEAIVATEIKSEVVSEVPESKMSHTASLKYESEMDTESLSKTEAEPEEEKPQISKGQLPIQNNTQEELASPQKENKQKEIKKCVQPPVSVTHCPVVSPINSDKQATRKSERIDREKTKRGSSPRGEAKSTAKSPVHGADPDGPDQGLSVGRRSRRNVKSVYATLVELQPPVRPGKEVPESPRAGRKRGTDKEVVPQNSEQEPPPAPAPAVKRGRPPKNRKQSDENASVKAEKSKAETKDTDSNESESGERTPRTSKGRHSPHGSKSSSHTSTLSGYGSGRKGDNAELADEQEMDITDEDAVQDSLTPSKDEQTKYYYKKEEKDREHKETGKTKESSNEQSGDGKSNKEAESTEEKHSTDKDRSGKGKNKLPKVPKSPVLKDLKIRLHVTEVKDLLQLGEDELASQEDSSKKVRATDPTEVSKVASSVKVVPKSEEKDIMKTDKEPLEAAKIQELEQAVENIAKLTEPTFPAAPTPTENKSDPEPEEDKPIPNETELMAAIDSITGEDTPMPQPPPASAEVGSEPEIQDNVQSGKEVLAETDASNKQEQLFYPSTPKKGAKGRKTPKRPKGQKHTKKDVKEESTSEELSSTAESPAPTVKVIPEKTPPAVAAVITPTSWNPMPEPSVVKSDVKAEIERPEDHGASPKSVYPQPSSPVCPKPQQVQPESVAMSPTYGGRTNVRPPQAHRPPSSSPDWLPPKDSSGPSVPSISIPTKDQSLPHKAERLESEQPDLRTILMQHKNMPLFGGLTPTAPLALRDQNISDSQQLSTLPNKSPLPESRLAAHPVPPIVRPPASLPSPETKTVISVIASTATSVISRVCNTPEHEDKVTNAANPCIDMSLPKPTYRPSKDDHGPYHGQSGDDVGSARFIIDSPAPTSGSCPGLRVNTSEGVVLLSHSMQKLEGRQRISAKISQIPQATAGDMESQQLVSMPQIKQDMYGHPQSGLQKGSSQTDHGHPGKSQPMKHDVGSLDKIESAYQPGPQGVVKRLPVGNQPVMGYHQDFLSMKHPKKMDTADPHSSDALKPSWTAAISPAISPHLPSPPGNHVSFVTGSDRAPPHLQGVKQEPRSPRKSGHPQSPFAKGSSSPKGIPVMLPTNLPSMQPFMAGVHHPEQSVIMPTHSGALGRMSPHRVNQSIPVGHLVQGEVHVNTPPLSVMNFGMHGDPLASPWSAAMQPRPTSPQTVNRDKVLKVNSGALRSHEADQEEARRFHQVAPRQPGPPLKPDSMQPDPRMPMRSAREQYMGQRDMRILMHQQGDRPAADAHTALLQEPIPPSSTPTSLPLSISPRQPHLLSKGISEKELTKQLEAKRPNSPLLKDGMMAIRQSGPAIGSPQRVPMMPPGPSGSFQEYPGLYSRGMHPPMPEPVPPVGLPQPHAPPTMMGTELQPKPESKISQPMVQLLNKYPIVWQGLLALKNDTAAVQLHFVCGNNVLARRSLPLQEGGALLRIAQRMRLEAPQLESVARRMTGDSDFCLLLALPCGRDQEDVLNQTQALKSAFINYLQSKLAAGIINIPNPGSNQPAYVLQIFPPCEFSESHLSQLAPDLLNRISTISPHLMIVITSA